MIPLFLIIYWLNIMLLTHVLNLTTDFIVIIYDKTIITSIERMSSTMNMQTMTTQY